MRVKIFAITVLMCASSIYAETITVPNGTVIPIRTVQQLSSDQLTLGQQVIFDVAMDVLVEGKPVILAGSTAYGSVQESKDGQMAGIAGKLVIALNSVVAVDGTNISISGSFSNAAKSEVGATVAVGVILCPLALLNTGDDGIIPVGMQVRAISMGSYEIVVE